MQAEVRIGDSIDIPFKVTEPEIYPAELYYLMDVSYSMRNDMEKMKRMGGEIAQKEHAWKCKNKKFWKKNRRIENLLT